MDSPDLLAQLRTCAHARAEPIYGSPDIWCMDCGALGRVRERMVRPWLLRHPSMQIAEVKRLTPKPEAG